MPHRRAQEKLAQLMLAIMTNYQQVHVLVSGFSDDSLTGIPRSNELGRKSGGSLADCDSARLRQDLLPFLINALVSCVERGYHGDLDHVKRNQLRPHSCSQLAC